MTHKLILPNYMTLQLYYYIQADYAYDYAYAFACAYA
jgi:hypothetical protein